uniref:Uncharacterized protein n=1 Tax=Chromera velia CCMP2878 TaxID=1169474 RepID=A0A0G4HPD5_9ALVE|mmetsp:Transcript_18496/g.37422  ORF Transcript_18496/g.37422 Transcript_18496/m.37422 type:complete len:216 (+) Transcript_18496:74-721(+)|eukprot:Cvel_29842.t1-p1 / transcript=Cvel_29842.t1 / gene=Cvel_29842 / organism=Chromera_velia_CCMP2878 / gene_product=hypothetical protein / transcript_product=hypothetical protein / location=Cvel_scaffold4159:7297-8126(+) / protein_length=215 / sequence_SO=supercontig / SO=protein_coding / is_pseudo=false
MAKGLRSKVKQRFRAAKRDVVNVAVKRVRVAKLGSKTDRLQQGEDITEPTKKNAFLYPGDPEASFPQKKAETGVDLRSEAAPSSFYAGERNRRKPDSHPENRELPDHVRTRAAVLKAYDEEMAAGDTGMQDIAFPSHDDQMMMQMPVGMDEEAQPVSIQRTTTETKLRGSVPLNAKLPSEIPQSLPGSGQVTVGGDTISRKAVVPKVVDKLKKRR